MLLKKISHILFDYALFENALSPSHTHTQPLTRSSSSKCSVVKRLYHKQVSLRHQLLAIRTRAGSRCDCPRWPRHGADSGEPSRRRHSPPSPSSWSSAARPARPSGCPRRMRVIRRSWSRAAEPATGPYCSWWSGPRSGTWRRCPPAPSPCSSSSCGRASGASRTAAASRSRWRSGSRTSAGPSGRSRSRFRRPGGERERERRKLNLG